MKRIFTLLLSLFAVTFAMAQAPTGVIKQASVAPEIDGVVDAVWAEANVYSIEAFDPASVAGVPTVGNPGETTWKGLWGAEGIFILLQVTDDEFYPAYGIPSTETWNYDKPEIYFDVNYNLLDGKGPNPNIAGFEGHHQFAPPFVKDKIDGTPITDNGVIYANMVDGSNYISEYFIPYSKLIDKDKAQVDLTNTVGFDITINDRDPGDKGRRNQVWSSALQGAWDNMDASGTITFDGAVAPTPAETITLVTTSGTITTLGGTFQLQANVDEAATIKTVAWTVVGGTAQVTISATGLITAITNGTIILKASTTDGSLLETANATVTITGQKSQIKFSDATWNEKNLITNWNFTENMDTWGGWVDLSAIPTAVAPASVDGVAKMVAANHADIWRYQHSQSPLAAEADVEYTVMFKSWSTGTSPCVMDFESGSDIKVANGGDQYNRYGATTETTNGRSEWNYTATIIPSWFTFHVTFDQIMETTVQKMQWMISKSDETIFMDSVLLVKTQDIDIISKVSKNLSNSLKVYTTENSLTVQLSSAVNTKIAIYNAIGQKMMEKMSTGNIAKFDVSSLRRGMYFVRLADGTTQKFIK